MRKFGQPPAQHQHWRPIVGNVTDERDVKPASCTCTETGGRDHYTSNKGHK
jgi:hypothetical protein